MSVAFTFDYSEREVNKMSGARLTRRVTVEGGKKLPDTPVGPSSGGGSSSAPGQRRLSVFDRLGPGAVDVSAVLSLFMHENMRITRSSVLRFTSERQRRCIELSISRITIVWKG